MTKTSKKKADKTAKTTRRSNGAKKKPAKTTKLPSRGAKDHHRKAFLNRIVIETFQQKCPTGSVEGLTEKWVNENCKVEWNKHVQAKRKKPGFTLKQLVDSKWCKTMRDEITKHRKLAHLFAPATAQSLLAAPLAEPEPTRNSTQQDEFAGDDDDEDMIDGSDDPSDRQGSDDEDDDDEEDEEEEENEPPVNDDDSSRLGVGATGSPSDDEDDEDDGDEEEEVGEKENEPPVNETEELRRQLAAKDRQLADVKAERKEEKRQMAEKLADEKAKRKEEKRQMAEKLADEKAKRKEEKRQMAEKERQLADENAEKERQVAEKERELADEKNKAEEEKRKAEEEKRKRQNVERKLEAMDQRLTDCKVYQKKHPKYNYMAVDEAQFWCSNSEQIVEDKIVDYKSDRDFKELQRRQEGESNVALRRARTFNLPAENGYAEVGVLHLAPTGIKDIESRRGTFSCTVLSCEPRALELAIADPEGNGKFVPETAQRFLLETGDQFVVPSENEYRLENHSKTCDCSWSYNYMRANPAAQPPAEAET